MGYGCTELSPVVAFKIDHDVRTAEGRIVGGNRLGTAERPPGTLIKTLSPETVTELPAGSEGIICVKGPQLMVGYLDNPKATAEALKDVWYITGDIGRLDDDGFLILGGRLARFSMIGGEMVPDERIEEAVRNAAGVDDRSIVVTAIPDQRRGERLVVLYTDLGGKSPARDISLISNAGHMPKLWIPADDDYIKGEAIPRLGNGKVDLGQLCKIAQERIIPATR